MSCGEGLYAVRPGNPGFRVQPTEPGNTQVAQRDGAGEPRLLRAAGCGAPDVFEHKGRDSPMRVSGRTFVGRAQMEVGEYAAAFALLDHEGRRHGIAHPDHDIAQGIWSP
jgi:hypothetical protein